MYGTRQEQLTYLNVSYLDGFRFIMNPHICTRMYIRYVTKSLKSPEEKNDLLAHDMEDVKEKREGS